eukprot:3812755-Pyramimonas_sp.AAC.1
MYCTRKPSNTFAPPNVLHAPDVSQPHKSIAPNLLHHPLVAGPPSGSTRIEHHMIWGRLPVATLRGLWHALGDPPRLRAARRRPRRPAAGPAARGGRR